MILLTFSKFSVTLELVSLVHFSMEHNYFTISFTDPLVMVGGTPRVLRNTGWESLNLKAGLDDEICLTSMLA